jgi:hypothetical protein
MMVSRRARGEWAVQIPGILLITILLSSVTSGVNAEVPGTEPALGPLDGRNMYAPHLPWFSFSADSAAPLSQGDIRISSALYALNEFSSYPFNPDDYILDADGRLSTADQNDLTALDYESTIMELGIDWQALPEWRFSADWRLHARYGGFMDGTIEWWHGLFGLSNAGREYFDRNRSDWNIRNTSGSAMKAEGTVWGAGDLDLLALWSFLEAPKLNLAARAAFKIPLGRKDGGFSSGYPVFGTDFLLNWQPWNRWVFYLETGIIIPLGGGGRIMGQFIPAVEFRASGNVSLLLQMNIQSSPVSGDVDYIHPVFGRSTMFALPQTDLKIGIKGRSGRFGWQFFMEEDPLTWEGPDILIFMGFDWTFSG